jgi:hypothetical protein
MDRTTGIGDTVVVSDMGLEKACTRGAVRMYASFVQAAAAPPVTKRQPRGTPWLDVAVAAPWTKQQPRSRRPSGSSRGQTPWLQLR